jgi:hypothetical protein
VHRAIELAGETARRVFPGGLDRRVELQRRGLGEADGGLVRRPLEALQLTALDISEARLDTTSDVRLLALDPLGHPAVASLQPLVHLFHAAPALGCMQLELRPKRRDGRIR